MAESFGHVVMYAGLVLMAGLVAAVSLLWLRAHAGRAVRRMRDAFSRLPLAAQIVVAAFVLNLIVYGSTKSPTNDPPVDLSLPVDGEAPATFTEEELAAGVVRTWVRTNESWRFDLPAGATVVEPWCLRGAADDWARFATPNLSGVVFAGGRLQDAVRAPRTVYAPLQTTLGVAPEANWGLVAATGAASRVWYGMDAAGTVAVTWQDVLLARATNMPVSLQALFGEDGRVVYRYDLSRADPAALANAWAGVVTNGHALGVALATNVTSVGWYRIQPADLADADRDGDGLATRDEVYFFGTDPGLADTDCDGLSDFEEVVRGTSPLVPDTDGDGLVDGSDPDPLSATASDDLDGDGIPDAYEDHWFGGTNAVDAAGARDETGFTLATKLQAGMCPTNAAAGCRVVSTNELVGWRLWDGFAARHPAGSTNLVFERTVDVGRANTLQQFYLSSAPDGAGAWRLEGMTLEIAWRGDDGAPRVVAVQASPNRDSWRIPLGSDLVQSLTFRLRATADVLYSPTPVHLLAWAPRLEISGGKSVDLGDGTRAFVFTEGASSAVALDVDRSARPCRAALTADERDVSGLGEIVADAGTGGFRYVGGPDGGMIEADGPGVYDFPAFGVGPSAPAPRPARAGARLVVLEPGIGWYGVHGAAAHCADRVEWQEAEWYKLVDAYPLDSKCLREAWYRSLSGGVACTCEARVASGLGERAERDLPWLETSCTSGAGTAVGSVRVAGVPVWSGGAEHAWALWHCEDLALSGDACGSCDGGCADGNCDSYEGVTLGSLKFRIPLGTPRRGQISGFAYFRTEEPVRVTPATFLWLLRADAAATVATNGTTRTAVCRDERGRTLVVESIPDGVRATVTTTATGALEHSWEIVHVDGALETVRFRRISRLGNVMEDRTVSCVPDGSTGGWKWQALDNVAGLREEVVDDDRIDDDGSRTEVRSRHAADGSWLGTVERRSELVGWRDAAVLRETHYRETSPGHVVERRADYWTDMECRARNGRLRFASGTDRAWEYHAWTENGHERLRVEPRNGSAAPETFPDVDGDGTPVSLEGLEDAFVTVFDYTPLPGDAGHGDEHGRVRLETRYVVENGVATCIGRTWHRFTHVVAGGYAAVREETWRAKDADAAWDAPGNAHSHVTTFSESDAAAVPLALRGQVAGRLEEDGVLSATTVSAAGGRVALTTRRSFAGFEFPDYEVVELDAVHGTELRRATCRTSDDAVVAETTHVYDEKNRLRSTTHLDGTSLTNAYSCCRLLWSRDRAGRKTLRSAATGFDHLYHAEEDVWLADISTNGAYRITRRYFDALGRETNTVVTLGTTPGEAVPTAGTGVPSVDPARIVSMETTTYPYGAADHAVRVDARGRTTVTGRSHYGDGVDSYEIVSTNGVEVLRTTNFSVFGGGSRMRSEWHDWNWTEERRFDAYLPDGRRVAYVVTAASDCDVVTNSVSTYDLLGRLVSTERPGADGAWIVVSNAYDGATTRRLASTQFAPGLAPRTTTYLHNAWGEEVGTALDGVTNRTDVAYATISNAVWRVETTVTCGASTNSVSITRTRLTDLSDACRSHVVTHDGTTGVETEKVTAFDPATKIETTTETSSITTPTVRRTLYGLVLSVETSEAITHNAYDGLGRVAATTRETETDTLGVQSVQDFVYAPCGDLVATFTYTNATDGVSESYVYDSLGNRVEETDALGNSTYRTYDPLGQVLEEGGATYPVRYTYDTQGRRMSLATTRDGSTWDTTTWTYDPATGLCLSKTYADGTATLYSYTADGLPLRTTHADGTWREYVYDARRIRAGMLYTSPDMAYEIQNDEFGRAVSASNAVFAVAYERADDGLATNEVITVGAQAVTLVRGQDAFARQTSLAVSDAPTVFFAYNEKGDVSAVSNAAFAVAYHFTSDGLDAGYTLTTAAGIQLKRMVTHDGHRQSLITAVTNTVGASPLQSFDYAYDAGSRVAGRNGDVFTYNARNEVAGAVLDDISYLYAYDGIGSFVSTSRNGAQTLYAANSLNQYTAVSSTNGVTSPVYDTNGNLISDGIFTYTWDDENRLVSVAHGDEEFLTNEYDTQARRVRKTTPTATHTFVYDGWNLVKETIVSANGQTDVVDYVWGRDLSGGLQGTGGVGGLLAVRRNGSWFFPFYDNNGNVTAYVDTQGAVVAEYTYDAFGNAVVQSGTLADAFAHRFSTKYRDAETGHYYYGYRFYSPVFARWLSRDPMEEDENVNLYLFCGNRPLGQVDYLGLLTFWEAFKHYVSGEIDPKDPNRRVDLNMNISKVFTWPVKPEHFPGVKKLLSSCKEGEFEISQEEAKEISFEARWHQFQNLLLGAIILKLDGTLEISSNGDWTFRGFLSARKDIYDFNPSNHRSLFGEIATWIGGLAPGGKVYDIHIHGQKFIPGRGNCCSKIKK